MLQLLLLLLALARPVAAVPSGPYAQYLFQVDATPFIVVDKQALRLALVDAQGEAIRE